MTGARRVVIALRAAWRTPAAIDGDLASLLTLGSASRAAPDPAPARTLRATQRLLTLLCRMPGGRWRGTCLYRSTASCLALRAGGHAARVVVGVEPGGAAGVMAHAWVDAPTAREALAAEDTARFVLLRAPG